MLKWHVKTPLIDSHSVPCSFANSKSWRLKRLSLILCRRIFIIFHKQVVPVFGHVSLIRIESLRHSLQDSLNMVLQCLDTLLIHARMRDQARKWNYKNSISAGVMSWEIPNSLKRCSAPYISLISLPSLERRMSTYCCRSNRYSKIFPRQRSK